MPEHDKTTYLLGAGASAEAGFKLASQMTALFLTQASSILNSGQWGSKLRIARALTYVVATLQLDDVKRSERASLELPGIERLVSAAKLLTERETLEVSPFVQQWDEMVASLEAPEPPGSFPPMKVGPFIESIRKLSTPGLSRYRQDTAQEQGRKFADAVRALTSEGRPVNVFTDLVHYLEDQLRSALEITESTNLHYLYPLVRHASATKSTIATLNYDLTIEEAAKAQNISVSTLVNPSEWSGQLLEPADCAVRLLKLHGSVDWHLRTGVGDERVKSLIFGQREKLTHAGPFLQLLEKFRLSLQESSSVVIVGYSFGDAHVNELLRMWRRSVPEKRVLICDPFALTEEQLNDRRRKGYSDTNGSPPWGASVFRNTASAAFEILGRGGVEDLFAAATS